MNRRTERLADENRQILMENPIFDGLSGEELDAFIRYAAPDFMELEPEQSISIAPGDKRELGIVLKGDVKVFTIDYSGVKTVLNALHNTGHTGTMQFMVNQYNMLYEIVADTPSTIMRLDPDTLLIPNSDLVLVQHKILVNLMDSQRSLFLKLSEHLVCLSQKNIRDKVLRYLLIKSEAARSYEFDVPLSREDMAAYLAVDRASLSRTLGNLKREGVIDFRKNHFKILDTRFFRY